MRLTIKGLRRWIVGAAGLLLVVVAGFLLYGRYLFRHIEKDLPGKLGINIQQTATGWSYSQSSQGHTLFTLKASKESQLKSGHVLLHDVDITMYGPPGSGRQDRIYGSDFEYDQNTGIAVSQGDVNIELAGIGGSSPAGSASSPAAGNNTIRVRTRGLSFARQTGVADTTQAVDFQLPRAAGSSVGANYDSKSGVLVLNTEVQLITSSNGKAAVVHAAHATLLRASMQAFLTDASMAYQTEDGSADDATVYFRKDGTTEKIDAQGHVRMKTDTGATVASDTAHILMDAKSQPTSADLGGGVQFASKNSNETMHGSASEGTLLFASGETTSVKTGLRHAEFRHDVNFVEQIDGLAKDPHGHAEKQVQGQKVDVDFAPPHPGESLEARAIVADGAPVVTMRQVPSKGPAQTTRISGDHLVAALAPGNALRQLDGTGNTRVVNEETDGSRNTSEGDILHATFLQQPAPQAATPAPRVKKEETSVHPRAAHGPKMQTALDTAVQDGHVQISETPAKKPGETTQPATLTGWSQHAEYHASDQVLHLTGSPRVDDGAAMQISGDQINYHRDSQDADANGNVKATYTQLPKTTAAASTTAPPTMGGNGPVHVIAERASMHHATNLSDFYGTVKNPARMWQDPDALTAPVIEIDRNRNLLKAWGDETGKEPVVHATFTSAMGAEHQQSVASVYSETLVYSDKDRQADFRGNVTMNQATEAIHCDDGLVYFKPAQTGTKPAPSAADSSPKPQGTSQIDHMVATGHVVFTQPGRKGEGEKLVYTADDGHYVMTGTPETLPRLTDSVHGTTTGVALLFNSQDDSVEVSGGKSSAVTDTRAPK